MNHWLSAVRRGAGRLALCLCLCLALAASTVASAAYEDTLRRAETLAAGGDLNKALALLEETAATASAGITGTEVEGALLRIDLLRRLGKLSQAMSALTAMEARLAGRQGTGPAETAQLYHQRALLQLQTGDLESAETSILSALALESRLPPELQASMLNDAAVIRLRRGDSSGAIAQFLTAARRVAGGAAEASYRINAARAMLDDGQLGSALDEAERVSQLLPQSAAPSTAPLRIALAALYRDAVNGWGADATYRLAALELLQEAADDASVSRRNLSLGKGNIAQLYADDRQHDVALLYARAALNDAAQANAQDLEYRWEWILARAFAEMGESDSALAAYGRAIVSLRKLRSSLESYDPDTLEEIIKPLYYEYADALLGQTAGLENSAQKQDLLSDTRAALEELKLAEVQDYFGEQCLADEKVLLDQLAVNTVVLYPVMLENRLELLLTTESGIQQISVAVDRDALVALIRDFRLNIEVNTGTGDYLQQAQGLYDLLIRPLEPELQRQRIDTLVVVPDGPLRTIPLAALHDGEAFLIERYAVATTPGLTLIDPQPFAGRSYATLVGGLSESVQGFPALPGVNRELMALEGLFGARVLKNESFTLASVESELQSGNYSVVHFATHGQFADSYDNSFLLTYDDRLQINDLGRNIQARTGTSEPLELLVLSACETAAGDDRAALGLAGVALKAGARSALATLWEVDDESTVEIIREFYASLAAGRESKARSLQLAQLQLIRSGRHPHPSQWAPFLLIGNWL
ncbi:MAG: CHAT domain-containing protein [Haliea sp.]|uniref:CHAT domain-containing protein n=1 Tax=Haliea sp. TaxID=1932666 RepID=UPI0032EAC1ED